MTYQNPFQYGSDPFAMLDDDGYYYILCSGWRFYRTKDLVHYEDLGKAYEPKETDWFYGPASAPEIYHFGDKYYIFHTTEAHDNPYDEDENRKIGVLVADSPMGPFEDPLGRPLLDTPYCAIDIHVYHEDDHFYLYWCHSCYHHPVGRNDLEESWIYAAEMKPDFTGIIGDPILQVRPCQEWENHTIPLHKRRWNEGPFVLKHNGTYYMTFSGCTFEDYGVGYATAPTPLGPWTKAPENPILHEVPEKGIFAPGHNSFTWSKDGKELFMVYHMITDSPFMDPETVAENKRKPFFVAKELDKMAPRTEVDEVNKLDAVLQPLPTDGYALQHWPGYAPEYMNRLGCKDDGRKIAIDRVHFTEDGKMVLEGPNVDPQPFPSGNE